MSNVYAAYNGSQRGFTVRDSQLKQKNFVETSFSPTGIAAGDSNDVYLSTKDNLHRYHVDGKPLKKMNFPKITYTGVTFDAK
jgi:sugar lactone lactonase YvrE